MAQGVAYELNGCTAIGHVAYEVATALQHAANHPRVEVIVLDDEHLEAPLRLPVVVDGASDDIQSVYYAWAVEQLPATASAPLTWRLRDMMVRGFHAIV
jgi:hypothetical protein